MFNWITVIISAVYCVLNVAASFILLFSYGESAFVEIILGLDVYTWIIYGIFVFITLLLKVSAILKENTEEQIRKQAITTAVLQLVFSVISFGGIAYVFACCF